jgi:diguanylate cyclase (GGDEF)-like protein/PAS domain S-box-containing protein
MPKGNKDVVTATQSKPRHAVGWQLPLSILGALLALSFVVLFYWSQSGWITDVAEVERRELTAQLEQLRRGYDSELADLFSAVGDYAIWSETAEFARGNNPDYFGTSLDASSLARLEVDEFLVLTADRSVRTSLAVINDKATTVPVSRELLDRIVNAIPRKQLSTPGDSLRGIYRSDRGEFLFAARPIFENAGAGNVAGYISFARRLSDRAAQRVARYSPWSVRGYVLNARGLQTVPSEARAWATGNAAGASDTFVALGDDPLARGYLRVGDLDNRPLWVLRVEIPRSSTEQALATARKQRWALAVIGTLFAAFIAIWLYRLRRYDADQAAMEMRYRAIIEQADEGVLIVDADSRLVQEANPAMQRLVGFSIDELRGLTLERLLSDSPGGEPNGLASILRGQAPRGLELALSTSDGSSRPVEVSCTEVEMSDHCLLALVVRDLSLRKKAETQLMAKQKHLDRLAHHDQLTGLPNRLFLQAHMPDAIARAAAANRMLAVLFLDLDRFKHINDSRGHEVGDKLLQEIAKRVRAAVRPDDVVVRMGGDEFVVVLHAARTHDEVNGAAARINEVLSAPVVIDGRALVATTSIGVSVYPRDGASMGELLKHSDTAMYQAKDRGRNNFQVFSPLMDQKIKERVAIETNLRAALKLHQFDVHYQPIIDMQTRRVAAMEALLRWRHPSHGYISPARFIDVAEETGLIVPIGHFVLHRIAHDIARWRDADLSLVPIAMNVSAVQLERTNLKELIQRALAQHRIGPQLLQLELTEGSLFEKRTGESRDDVLEQLRELGVKIAIDDFGTGYSSLSYLKRLRVDTLKIDRGFVRDIATDQSDHAIVSAIVAMARNLNIKVVAEGIEGWQQLELLRTMGCHMAQGFLFAKPVPAAEAARFLQTLQVDLMADDRVSLALAETGT